MLYEVRGDPAGIWLATAGMIAMAKNVFGSVASSVAEPGAEFVEGKLYDVQVRDGQPFQGKPVRYPDYGKRRFWVADKRKFLTIPCGDIVSMELASMTATSDSAEPDEADAEQPGTPAAAAEQPGTPAAADAEPDDEADAGQPNHQPEPGTPKRMEVDGESGELAQPDTPKRPSPKQKRESGTKIPTPNAAPLKKNCVAGEAGHESVDVAAVPDVPDVESRPRGPRDLVLIVSPNPAPLKKTRDGTLQHEGPATEAEQLPKDDVEMPQSDGGSSPVPAAGASDDNGSSPVPEAGASDGDGSSPVLATAAAEDDNDKAGKPQVNSR